MLVIWTVDHGNHHVWKFWKGRGEEFGRSGYWESGGVWEWGGGGSGVRLRESEADSA